MCLITTTPYETSTKPITVWKVMVENHSVFRGTPYKPNVVRTAPRMRKDAKEGSTVYIGLHAYRTKARAVETADMPIRRIVKMTIPVGAHYYLGSTGDIVSDTLETGTLKTVPWN